ncbi:hypothetical protein ACTXG7_10795 [Mycolicibacterium sp. Dal123E01]|uniref:hypothetical protein n=1 Tax=Mycolicibacterium sp. Dal123E01 TaxID=3457578 RepID=UPI00403EA7E2
MSWESEHALDPGVPEAISAPPFAPLVAGFILGLVSMTATPFVYYWFLVPALPVILAVVVLLVGMKVQRLVPVAEGLFAAALFGAVFVAVAYAGLSTMA